MFIAHLVLVLSFVPTASHRSISITTFGASVTTYLEFNQSTTQLEVNNTIDSITQYVQSS